MEPITPCEQVQQLFVRHTGLLHGFITGLCGDLVLAEDILQDVFLVVTKRADTFVLGTDFLAWACTIARFKTMEHLRTRKNTRRMLGADALLALEADQPSLDEWQLQREALSRCIEGLSPRRREMVGWAYGEGLSAQEIAQREQSSENAVYVMLSKLRSALRECVGRRLEQTI